MVEFTSRNKMLDLPFAIHPVVCATEPPDELALLGNADRLQRIGYFRRGGEIRKIFLAILSIINYYLLG